MVTPAMSLFNSSSFLEQNIGKNLSMHVPDSQLKVPRNNPRLLVVPSSIASQLQDLSGKIFHYSCHVDWSSSSHSLGVVALPVRNSMKHFRAIIYVPEEPMDTAHRELESCPARARLCLSLDLASFAATRHCAGFYKDLQVVGTFTSWKSCYEKEKDIAIEIA